MAREGLVERMLKRTTYLGGFARLEQTSSDRQEPFEMETTLNKSP